MRRSILTKIHSDCEKLEICCPVCLFMCRDKTDFEMVQSDGACTECFTNFRHTMGKDWENGKRPTAKEARSRM